MPPWWRRRETFPGEERNGVGTLNRAASATAAARQLVREMRQHLDALEQLLREREDEEGEIAEQVERSVRDINAMEQFLRHQEERDDE